MSAFNDMVDFIKSAWPAKEFIVPCLVGPAGIGKTAACKQAAKELGAGKVVTIIASQILPNEVSGITMPVVETKAMEIFDHFRLSSLEDGDVLFFDELLEADQLVLSACLTLIESRELMSGRKLPDILIVAATNPTIKPNMLKENIRQRFVWRSFDVDPDGTREYIKRTCGFDIGMKLAHKLEASGNEYNILTPRSLTKMAAWMSQASTIEQAKEIGDMICSCWKNTLGADLYQAYANKLSDPTVKAINAIKNLVDELDVPVSDELFENSDLAEIISVLQELPEWDNMQVQLANMEMDEEEVTEIKF